MSDVLTNEEIRKYILKFTEAAKPECNDCANEAELFDQEEGDNYCRECLEKSLQRDAKYIKELLK